MGPLPVFHFPFAFSAISTASRASLSALRRLWFAWNSGSAWLSDIVCLDESGWRARRSSSSATCCSADRFGLIICFFSFSPRSTSRRQSNIGRKRVASRPFLHIGLNRPDEMSSKSAPEGRPMLFIVELHHSVHCYGGSLNMFQGYFECYTGSHRICHLCINDPVAFLVCSFRLLPGPLRSNGLVKIGPARRKTDLVSEP